MTDLYSCYNGIHNVNDDFEYQEKFTKAEPATCREMTPEEIKKYGEPTGIITNRIMPIGYRNSNRKKGGK